MSVATVYGTAGRPKHGTVRPHRRARARGPAGRVNWLAEFVSVYGNPDGLGTEARFDLLDEALAWANRDGGGIVLIARLSEAAGRLQWEELMATALLLREGSSSRPAGREGLLDRRAGQGRYWLLLGCEAF